MPVKFQKKQEKPAPAGRDALGRFPKGQSGNPAGRPPGTRNAATRLAEALLSDAAPDITRATLERAAGWLDSCATPGGGYGYMGAREETPTTTAIGLLCRQYLGWGPRQPGLIAGLQKLQQRTPGAGQRSYRHCRLRT